MDSKTQTVDVSPVVEVRSGAVTTLTLTRPGHGNSIDYDLGVALLDRLSHAAGDPECRVIVITGAGNVFCAGDDITAVQAARDGKTDGAPVDPATGQCHYLTVCEAIVTAPKPVVVGVNGATAGAGTEIACAADYRLGSDRARMGSGLLRVGYAGSAAMLPRVVGPARATELFLTARLVDADEAKTIGLLDRVVPHEHFNTELDDLAQHLATMPTKAFAEFKMLREQCLWRPVEQALRTQNQFHERGHAMVEDGAEGIAAFLERRVPDFRGR